MFRLKHVNRAVLALCAGGAAFGAVAQQQQTQSLERVEVTGSNIKRSQSEGAAPIQVITRDEIIRSGATSLNDILQNLSSAGQGGFSETNTNLSSGGGAAGISLRGLGLSYTLVLLDGRRVAPSGFGGATGVATFTDVNGIPVSAIDRVEVLKGSASAVYGADAVGGVINIILRKDLKGGEVSVFGGTTSRGDGEEKRANFTYGFGDLAADKFNLMASIDAYSRERIRSVDREYGKSADGTLLNQDLGVDSRSLTGNPGSFRVGTVTNGAFAPTSNWRAMPNCPTVDKSPVTATAGVDQFCLYNFLTAWDLLPPTDRIGAAVKGTLEISPTLSAFGRVLLNQNKLTFNVAPTPLAVGVVGANAPGNSLGQAYEYRYRITAGGPRVNEAKSDFQSFVGGLTGQFGKYDWEAAFNTSKSKNTNNGSGYANLLKVAAARADGSLAPYEFALDPSKEAAVAKAIAQSYTRIGQAKSDAVDAKISGDLFALPAGPLSFAAGVEFRKESISDSCITPECSAGAGGTSIIDGANSTKAGGSRKINAQYLELRGAVFKGLDVTLAMRRDAYDGESDPNPQGQVLSGKYSKTVPQLSVEYRPTKSFLLRGVIGEGFKAPTLFEAYQATSESFNSGAAWRDLRRFPVTGSREDSGATQVKNFRGGQPALKPEESQNLSIGIVFEPFTDFSVSLDAYAIYLRETIGLPSVSRLLAREAANRGDPLVTRAAPSPADTARGIPGAINFLTLTYANLGATRVKGADLDAEYRWRTASYGRFTVRSVVSYMSSYKQEPEPGAGLVEYIGTYDLPRLRLTSSARWTNGPWDVLWQWRHTGAQDQLFQNVPADEVKPENYHDVGITYTGFKNLTVTAGVRNVFDKQPSFANGDSQNFNYTYGDPRGRGYWLNANYKF